MKRTRLLDAPFSQFKLLCFAFLIPFTILTIIYGLIHTAPFGTGSLLTIDLGQQYVDFFAYFRQTVLENPSAIFYSFSKSLGGDMVGLWAYYLTSPFNVIFLLLPKDHLVFGVTLLILTKISLCSVSFAYFLRQKYQHTNRSILFFALSYGLMSFITVNQFNIIWLDGLIWLPVIVLGLERLIQGRNPLHYVIPLAIAVFSNYYIAYMICLFLILFFPLSYMTATPTKYCLKRPPFWQVFIRFGLYSIISVALVSFLLLPTAYSLVGGKASYNSFAWTWDADYNPILLLSKLYFGSFDFDQMPTGYPNIFVGSIALVSYLAYFFSRHFKWLEKLYALALTIFLIASMNFDTLNKIWHGGQFPIWYPYRFSFVFSFLIVYLGYRWYTRQENLTVPLASAVVFVLAFNSYYFMQHPQSYLQPWQLFIGFSLTVLAMIFLMTKQQAKQAWRIGMALFILVELGLNSAVNVMRLSYVDQVKFDTYQKMLASWHREVAPQPNQFYRVEKTFQRSKDDAMFVGFYGINHFASTLEKELPTIFGYLGVAEGSGFISYSNGTLFTDSLFGIRYMIQNNNLVANQYTLNGELYSIHEIWTRKDLNYNEVFTHVNQATIFQNNYALALSFPMSTAVNQVQLSTNQPIMNQNIIAQLLSDYHANQNIFTQQGYSIEYTNVEEQKIENSNRFLYTKIDKTQPATITVHFTPATNRPYYIVLDGSTPKEAISLQLNGEKYQYYPTYRHDPIFNLASKARNESQTFVITLEEETLKMKKPKLYDLDVSLMYDIVREVQLQGLHITHFSPTEIIGKANLKQDSTMVTTIPYSKGWHVTVDDQPVETFKVLDSLMAYEISAGEHHINYHYETAYLREGVIVSIVALLALCACLFVRKRRQIPIL